MRKNNVFVAKIVNMRLTKIFMAIFAPDERLPSSATLIEVLFEIQLLFHAAVVVDQMWFVNSLCGCLRVGPPTTNDSDMPPNIEFSQCPRF